MNPRTTPIPRFESDAVDLGEPSGVPLARPALAVPRERLLQDWKAAHARADAYLAALRVPAGERQELALRAVETALAREPWPDGSDAVAETLAALRALVGRAGQPACTGAPALARGAMPVAPLTRSRRRGQQRTGGAERADSGAPPDPSSRARWRGAALRRRLLLGLLILLPSAIASGFMQQVLPQQGATWLERAIVLAFGALFGWISIGFWTALCGFWLLIRRRDRFDIQALPEGEQATGARMPEPPLPAAARTAIVMPICEEPVERVFAGLRAVRESLARTGALEHFDFFVLSDSHDPSTCVHEEEAWDAWCRETGGYGSIFYRRRRVRLKKKSGNVADFCRRWGRRYRYMILLDADSLMAGDTIVRLVRSMEQRPDAGMIQTVPVAVNRRTLFARVQQFAARAYGPMFSAGLHFWQLGDGQYWGHNAIIRVAPFMEHCGLPRLSGSPPWGGDILSHDFVEAALLGRAGWTLWLAYDLGGSYEEAPASLLEEMKRDRRWCQGNLQHLRLLFARGMYGAHRALFLNGVFSYTSALLWLGFLGLSSAEAIVHVLEPPTYFGDQPGLFPEWPVFRPHWAGALLGVTGVILFLPKLLAIVLALVRERGARGYGGPLRLGASVGLEILASSLLAPIRMLFHSKFVVLNLLGRTVSWRSQDRSDARTTWGTALRHHGLDTLLASAWGLGLFALHPGYFWWLTPILGALVVSIPLSVFASRVAPGEAARRRGLFVIPEEREPPAELVAMRAHLARLQAEAAARPPAERDGFVRAIVDPTTNAVHRGLLRGPRTLRDTIRAHRRELLERALQQGPESLHTSERRILLGDPDLVHELHCRVWALDDPTRAAHWGLPHRLSPRPRVAVS